MTDQKENILHDITFHEDTVSIQLWYPRDGVHRAIEVGLVDVRAADSIRIEYDFDRDGWVIKQASRFSWEVGEKPERDWQEVAFVKAWARQTDAFDE